MPRLPTKDELGQPNMRGRSSVPDLKIPDMSGVDIGKGISALGKGLQQTSANLSVAIKAKRQEDDAIGVTQAEAYEKEHKLELERSFDSDPDYATYGDRYESKARDIDDEAAKYIPNPRLRERWKAEASVRTSLGKNRLAIISNERGGVVKRVALLDSLDAHRRIYETAADPAIRQQALADMDAAITVNMNSGLIDERAVVQLRHKYLRGAAVDDATRQIATNPDSFMAEVDTPRYATLTEEDKANLTAQAEQATEELEFLPPVQNVVRQQGYELMATNKMTPEWLDANKDMLSLGDYLTFTKGKTETSNEMSKEDRLDVLTLTGAEANQKFKELYLSDQITREEYVGLSQRTREGRTPNMEARASIRKALVPDPSLPWTADVQLEALQKYDIWFSKNKGVTPEEIDKMTKGFVEEGRRRNYVLGAQALPRPKYVAAPNELIDADMIKEGMARVVAEVQAGRMTMSEAAAHATNYRRWLTVLRYKGK